MNLKNKNMKYSKGKIYQYTLDGKFKYEYENMMDVEFKLGINAGTLGSHLSNKSRHCQGFLFSRKFYLKYPICFLGRKPNKKMQDFEKVIYSYKNNGDFIKKFNNLKEVSERKDVRCWIRACLKGENKTYDDKIWLFEYYDKLPEDLLNKILNKRIIQINEIGEIVNVYKNISEAARKTGFGKSSISLVVAGKRNGIYGNRFKKYSEYIKDGNV